MVRSYQQFLPAFLYALPVLVAGLVELAGWGTLLRLEREALLAGEWWRLLTGHLAHLGGSHLLWNAAGFALGWLLVRQTLSATGWAVTLVISALTTSVGLLWWLPQLEWYVGLSGVLHGALVAGALAATGSGIAWRAREGVLLLALLAAKLIWEQWAGPLPGTESAAGGPVVTEAHLFGALGGLLVGAGYLLRRRWPAAETS